MRSVILFCVTLFFAYLVGAFVALSFDIAAWAVEIRAVLGIAGSLVALAVAMANADL